MLPENGNTLTLIFKVPSSYGYNLSSDAAGGDWRHRPGRLLNAAGDPRNNNPLVGRRQETRLAMNRIVAAAPEICLTTSRTEHQRTSDKLRPGSPGTGEGRIYTITVQYQDASGYTSIKTTTVLKKKPR
jgi:hypothetical protein